MYSIGNVKIRGRLVLAPMFRVSTLPFRIMCRRYGAGLVFSEMLNGNAIERNNRSSLRQTKSAPEEKPVAMQLFGTKEDVMLRASRMLDCDIIDLNCGCPDANIMKQGAGAALLSRPNKIGEIVEHLVNNQEKPVTVKIRTGLNEKTINAVEVARIAEKAGASAITVHGRTAGQQYRGKADWEVIRLVKESVSIPVIANGDIMDERSANACMRETHADFLMIGRAAMGEPYIFKRINQYFRTGELLPRQENSDKLGEFFEYLALAKEHDCLTYPDLKVHAQWFTKMMRGGTILRQNISKAKTAEEIEQAMRGSGKP